MMPIYFIIGLVVLLLIPKVRHSLIHGIIHYWDHVANHEGPPYRRSTMMFVSACIAIYAAPFVMVFFVLFFIFGVPLGYSLLGGLAAFVLFVVRLFFSYQAASHAMAEVARAKGYFAEADRTKRADAQ